MTNLLLIDVIDLSDTEKYYHASSFESVGVSHYKMNFPGHKLPDEEFLSKFCGLVREMEGNLEED